MEDTFDASKVKGSITWEQLSILRAAADGTLFQDLCLSQYFNSATKANVDQFHSHMPELLRWGMLTAGSLIPATAVRVMEITDYGRYVLTNLPEGV